MASDYYECDHTRATFNIIFQIRDVILRTSASQRFLTKFCPGQCSKLFSLYKDSVIALLHNTEIHAKWAEHSGVDGIVASYVQLFTNSYQNVFTNK